MQTHAIALILLIGFSLFSCSGSRKAIKPIGTVLEKEELLLWVHNSEIDPEWFSAKGKVLYKSDYDQIRFTINVRVRKDSVIWMNVKKLGIEVARILVRSDSVFVLDRLGNGFVADDLSFIAKEYNVPVDFLQMKNLLLGNPHALYDSMDVVLDSQYYNLQYENSEERLNLWFNNWNFTLAKEEFQDKAQSNLLNMQLFEYNSIGDSILFSTKRIVDISGPDFDDFFLNIQLLNLEFDVPKTIKFHIPDHYERINP